MKAKQLLFLPLLASLFLYGGKVEKKDAPSCSAPLPFNTVLRANDDEKNLSDYFLDNVPTEFGQKVGDYFSLDDKYYQNFEAGYRVITLTEKSHTIKNYAGRNIDKDGKTSKVALDKLLKYVADDFCTSGGDDFSKNLSNASSTKPIIETKMKALYTAFYNKDIILGVKNSYVKCWDGYIVQDFAFGDSSFTFDGNRYGMSFIFYNYKVNDDETKGECFALSGVEAAYWDSNKTQLGYPLSNLITDTVTLPGESEASKTTFQMFEGGLLYRDATGAVNYKNGYTYDETSKSFIASATPYVDSKYGAFQQEFASEDKSTIIKVHKKGSVICTLANGEYSYTYRPARIYKSLTEFDWYNVNDLLNDVGDKIEGDYEDAEKISLKLKKKYKDLYKSGFFVGFKEQNFHGNWNGIDAQQFILGDSSANPWGDARTNVAALVYNKTDDKVVLLANNALYLWNKDYDRYGAPLDDAFEVDGDVFQRFEGGLLVILRNNVDTSFLYDGTYEEYVEGRNNYEKPTYGKTVEVEIKIPSSSSLPLILGISIPVAIILLGGATFFFMRAKKKKAKNGK